MTHLQRLIENCRNLQTSRPMPYSLINYSSVCFLHNNFLVYIFFVASSFFTTVIKQMERVIVVIDKSGSMNGSPLKLAKQYGKNKNPTSGSIWAFDTECVKCKQIDDIRCRWGGTRIGNAMETVFKDMKNQSGYQKQSLYFITDAQDDVSQEQQTQLIKDWKYLQQNKNAVGEAHFFGTVGRSKDFLELCLPCVAVFCFLFKLLF